MSALRRQALAGVVALVLAVACAAWTLRDWTDYRDRRDGEVTRVAAGEEGRLDGAAYTVIGTERVPGASPRGERLEVAPDAVLVVVTVAVEPGGDTSPEFEVLRTRDPETRWRAATYDETSFEPRQRYEGYVDTEATAPYELQLAYVVPASDADALVLEVRPPLLRTPSLRLELASGPPPGR